MIFHSTKMLLFSISFIVPEESLIEKYAAPSLVVVAIVALLAAVYGSLREVPEEGDYLKLTTPEGTDICRPSRRRQYEWQPRGQLGGIDKITVRQKKGKDGIEMYLTVIDTAGYSVLRDARILPGQKLDVGPQQYIERLTSYDEYETEISELHSRENQEQFRIFD